MDDHIKRNRYRLINSVLVVKDDQIVLERYYNRHHEYSRNHIKSIWKSILSLLTGICLDKGFIQSIDEPIYKYLPEFGAGNHPYHDMITIRHLLTMTSGVYWNGGVHYHCPMVGQMMRTNHWMRYIADISMSDLPGTRFVYKEWDVLLLSAIIGKAVGATSYDVCKEYLYTPLEIFNDTWPVSPCGVSYTVMKGEERSDLSARDLMKIGILMLHRGVVSGVRIISPDYLAQVTRPSAANSSYGLLWWISNDGYGCKGFGGQEINVVPGQNLVTVIQATPTASNKYYSDIHAEILMELS